MTVEYYIPHRRTMKLLNKIADFSKDHFTTEVLISNESLLVTNEGVPTYAGLEYMAQSIAAFNSYHFKNDALSKLGFIVSIRNYQSTHDFYPLNSLLTVHINPTFVINNSGTFSCEIKLNDEVISIGAITAYVPTNEELEKLKRETL